MSKSKLNCPCHTCGSPLKKHEKVCCSECRENGVRCNIDEQLEALTEAGAEVRKLPPDQDNMNDDRSQWAAEALVAFMRNTNTDFEDSVCDLIADLGHFCDRHGLDFNAEVQRGLGHYREETLDVKTT